MIGKFFLLLIVVVVVGKDKVDIGYDVVIIVK